MIIRWLPLVVARRRVSVWNCAHNVGGGIPPLLLGMAKRFNDWKAALYMPAFGAIVVALFAFAMMRDTPQSCGLPPEEYKTTADDATTKSGRRLTAEANLPCSTLPDKYYGISLSPACSSTCCAYGILDWSPTYLKRSEAFRTG